MNSLNKNKSLNQQWLQSSQLWNGCTAHNPRTLNCSPDIKGTDKVGHCMVYQLPRRGSQERRASLGGRQLGRLFAQPILLIWRSISCPQGTTHDRSVQTTHAEDLRTIWPLDGNQVTLPVTRVPLVASKCRKGTKRISSLFSIFPCKASPELQNQEQIHAE